MLVDELYEEHGSYSQVINKLKADETLDESVRKVALQIANSCKLEDVGKLLSESWQVLILPDWDTDAYRGALEKVEKAKQLIPNDHPDILTVLGVAQYRVGAYEDALGTLTHAEKIRKDSEAEPVNVAFIAMALHRLDRQEEAKAALEQLRDLCKDEQFAEEHQQAQAFLTEAEKLIAGEKQ